MTKKDFEAIAASVARIAELEAALEEIGQRIVAPKGSHAEVMARVARAALRPQGEQHPAKGAA